MTYGINHLLIEWLPNFLPIYLCIGDLFPTEVVNQGETKY